ncbi:MAG: chorismate-binding protein [Bacteroidota bacterium]
MMNQLLLEYQQAVFELSSIPLMKKRLLQWADAFECCCYLDSNGYASDRYGSQECLIGVGVEAECVRYPADPSQSTDFFDDLRRLHQQHQDWIFTCFSYDLKNDIEQLSSTNFDGLGFPDYHFFVPRYVFEITDQQLIVHSKAEDPHALVAQIRQIPLDAFSLPSALALRPRMRKEDYLDAVSAIRQEIIEGVVYEMNFCQEFYMEECQLRPRTLFGALNDMSKAPFSAYYKLGQQYLLCASPERFMKKVGAKIISQPIKGTSKRSSHREEDEALQQALYRSEKDRAENVMIVDLVRNDLSRSCRAGSVQVEELFGIYSFEQVHQMISTVVGEMRPEMHFTDVLRRAFPMGSMTGAPKVMSMQLIEQYEKSRRGWYSGSVGYISPSGDFDFNVIIRSLLYQAERKYLSLQLGGAIVFDSVPELEYEECLLKGKAMQQLGIRLDSCQ